MTKRSKAVQKTETTTRVTLVLTPRELQELRRWLGVLARVAEEDAEEWTLNGDQILQLATAMNSIEDAVGFTPVRLARVPGIVKFKYWVATPNGIREATA